MPAVPYWAFSPHQENSLSLHLENTTKKVRSKSRAKATRKALWTAPRSTFSGSFPQFSPLFCIFFIIKTTVAKVNGRSMIAPTHAITHFPCNNVGAVIDRPLFIQLNSLAVEKIGVEEGGKHHHEDQPEKYPENAEEATEHHHNAAAHPQPAGKTVGPVPVFLAV